MGAKLKKIIEEFGLSALNFPDDLAAAMREQGIRERDVMTIQMILKCCPSVAGLLTRGSASEAEVNALICSAVKTTGLSVASVRDAMGNLMYACGFANTWTPYLSFGEKKVDRKIMPMTVGEGETLDQIRQRIEEDPEYTEVLSDLNLLAEQGNVSANYTLGQFYKVLDDQYGTETGRPYFQRAADQGYGPANGALADYMLRKERKNMAAAAKCFENPTALAGSDGREWINLSAQILRYREENQKRLNSLLVVQIVMLAITAAVLVLSAMMSVGGVVLSVLMLLLQAAALGWTLYGRIFKPYTTARYSCYAMILSWILLALSLL